MRVSGFVIQVHPVLRSLNCDGRRGLALLLACVLLMLPAVALTVAVPLLAGAVYIPVLLSVPLPVRVQVHVG